MRVLVFHGYLLHGTGSNIYNARLAEALVRAGHEVHLLCQDREPESLPWADAHGDWDGGALSLTVRRDPARATVYRPDIGGLLPVYVADRYDGIEARPFEDLSDEEVERYLALNVAAVREVAERARPDVALANHLVMGPVVLARALGELGVPYAVKIHGSALEYTVKPHPRFLPWAREGLAGASGILVGSRHTGESLWAAMDDPSVRERTRLGPPGVDVGAFRPRPRDEAREGLERLRRALEAAAATRVEREASERVGDPDAGTGPPNATGRAGAAGARPLSAFARDEGEAARALAEIEPEVDEVVVLVGKLIASKGVELLLAAWPLVLGRRPAARLVLVGFGAFREALEGLAGDLAAGELDAARALRAEDGRELPQLGAFLDSLDGAAREEYLAAAATLRDRIAWTGRLEHEELEDLLPVAEALVAPSTFPEAFGMVAAEGAACGALPIVARHSGLAEVSEALAARVPAPARSWLSFAVDDGAVTELAHCIAGWLDAADDLRDRTREAIVGVARERWSWDGVARTVVAAAEGRLDALPEP